MNNIAVIIETDSVDQRSGVSSRTGQPYSIRSQPARLKSDLIAGPISITLGDNQPAYPVGDYLLDIERSLTINRFGSVQVGSLVIIPKPSKSAFMSAAK
jgi:Helix-destabilising protein